MNWSRLNAAAIRQFGESVPFVTSGQGSCLVMGIVIRPGQPVARQLVASSALTERVLRPGDLLISVSTADVTVKGITVGDTATVDSQVYQLIQIWPDDAGMTALELRT